MGTRSRSSEPEQSTAEECVSNLILRWRDTADADRRFIAGDRAVQSAFSLHVMTVIR